MMQVLNTLNTAYFTLNESHASQRWALYGETCVFEVKSEKWLKMPPQDDETIQLMDFCEQIRCTQALWNQLYRTFNLNIFKQLEDKAQQRLEAVESVLGIQGNCRPSKHSELKMKNEQ